uniref:Ubiquitin carboxyl-terminal hydrolase n=1 Tax=Strigamia maritima TaxID=126957 RepID=T1J4C8_STRMM
MSDPQSLLSKYLHQIRVPQPGEKIYKDECAFSFDTPESENGLYICMNTFLGFGQDHVERHFRKTGNAVYLQLLMRKRDISVEAPKNSEGKKITRMAIGVEGGFDIDTGKKFEYDERCNVVILPDFVQIALPNPNLPEVVLIATDRILSCDSASKVEEAQALAGTWDGEKRPLTKHAGSLKQMDNGIRIRPRGWKCEMCDKVDNLWLNLTDGSILCGRRFFDGSGGNNHAIEHYKTTGYPLAVKLGTITPNYADVFSYDEDEMVENPNLPEQLAHFGINIAQMEKTDKSMIELEIDMNQRIGEWATIQEAGSQLIPLFGPGYTGLANLGNSCYLNSVMQVVFSISEFQLRYANTAYEIFDKAPFDPISDFNVQMAKLGHGLLSGKYSQPPPPGTDVERNANEGQPGIRPSMFKSLIGKGHTEFSTKRQQDAQEFFLHLLNVLERNNRGQLNPADCFKFKGEERMQCLNTGKVKYTYTTESILRVPIPLEAAMNKEHVLEYETKKAAYEATGQRLPSEEMVRARIPFLACLEAMATPKSVQGFFNTALQADTTVVKTSRMATYPDFLMIQLEKFTFEDGWIPKKLDVSIDVPDELDLLLLKGHGIQAGEELMPEDLHSIANAQPEHPPFQMDEVVVAQLAEMGFPVDACRRALFNIGCSDLAAAVTWLTEHIADADFTAAFIVPTNKPSNHAACGFVADETAIATIITMGFSPEQAKQALRNTDNNVERAVDWIFSHIGELEAGDQDNGAVVTPQFRDGLGRYRLVAFISHMGTSTMVGHYVCHIYKDGRWVIYNDNKVALSENPPKDLGYLYLFQRV